MQIVASQTVLNLVSYYKQISKHYSAFKVEHHVYLGNCEGLNAVLFVFWFKC